VCRYVDIIKANNMLLGAKKSGQTDIKIQAAEEMLQYHVATLIDNQLPNQPQASQRGGRPLKTIRERLVGKVCVAVTHTGVDALAVACCAVPCVSYCGQ
jgi:DNA-directed RNA polymerase beta' subunit